MDENILVDLRTKKEIDKAGSIKGALNIPVDKLRQRLDELDKEKTYILFCAIGLRGYIAHRILTQNGFKSKNISGGFGICKNTLEGGLLSGGC
jgi:rhodanese-related sulfurtransferase